MMIDSEIDIDRLCVILRSLCFGLIVYQALRVVGRGVGEKWIT